MITKSSSTKKTRYQRNKKFEIINRAVAVIATAFFIFNGIPMPASFAAATNISRDARQQFVPVVAYDPAAVGNTTNVMSAAVLLPSGAAVQNPNPLSLSTVNFQGDGNPPPAATEEIGEQISEQGMDAPDSIPEDFVIIVGSVHHTSFTRDADLIYYHDANLGNQAVYLSDDYISNHNISNEDGTGPTIYVAAEDPQYYVQYMRDLVDRFTVLQGWAAQQETLPYDPLGVEKIQVLIDLLNAEIEQWEGQVPEDFVIIVGSVHHTSFTRDAGIIYYHDANLGNQAVYLNDDYISNHNILNEDGTGPMIYVAAEDPQYYVQYMRDLVDRFTVLQGWAAQQETMPYDPLGVEKIQVLIDLLNAEIEQWEGQVPEGWTQATEEYAYRIYDIPVPHRPSITQALEVMNLQTGEIVEVKEGSGWIVGGT